jgi:hypothetical protein
VAAIRFAKTWKGCSTRCWGMYLHLRPRPMSREPAPPHRRQAPAACTEGGQRSQPWRWSGSPATEPSGPVTNLDPLDRLQLTPAAHWTHGGLGGVTFPPCCLPDPAGALAPLPLRVATPAPAPLAPTLRMPLPLIPCSHLHLPLCSRRRGFGGRFKFRLGLGLRAAFRLL